jgi:hypothetical protein
VLNPQVKDMERSCVESKSVNRVKEDTNIVLHLYEDSLPSKLPPNKRI